jgi:hypothetical protein
MTRKTTTKSSLGLNVPDKSKYLVKTIQQPGMSGSSLESQLLRRQRSGRLWLKPAGANSSQDPISKQNKTKHLSQKGLAECLKMQALSSNLSTAKKRKKQNPQNLCGYLMSYNTNTFDITENIDCNNLLS